MTRHNLPVQIEWPVVQLKQSHDLGLDVDELEVDGAHAVIPIFNEARAGDSLTLHWQGYYQGDAEDPWAKTITLDEVAISSPILILIPKIEFRFIEDGYGEVSYQLAHPDGGPVGDSPLQTVQIVPPVSARLAAPGIQGHNGNQPIDPGRFPDGIVVQLPSYPGIQVGDYLLLYAEGASADRNFMMSLRVDETQLQATALEFSVGSEWLLANQGAEVSLFYQYARPGTAKSSLPLNLNVLEPLDLPPPIVEHSTPDGGAGENSGLLLASAAISGVYVNVPEAVPLQAGDQLEVHWQGHPSGGQHVASAPVDGTDQKRFFVPASAVAANMGDESKRFEVFYRLTPNSASGQDSRPFNLRIQPLEQSSYPRIQWANLAGRDTLCLLDVPPGGEPLLLEKWTFMAEGHRVTIEATGVTLAGGPAHTIVRNALPVTLGEMAAEQISSRLSVAFLSSLKLNEHITLHVQVSFDGGQTPTYFRANNGVRLVACSASADDFKEH